MNKNVCKSYIHVLNDQVCSITLTVFMLVELPRSTGSAVSHSVFSEPLLFESGLWALRKAVFHLVFFKRPREPSWLASEQGLEPPALPSPSSKARSSAWGERGKYCFRNYKAKDAPIKQPLVKIDEIWDSLKCLYLFWHKDLHQTAEIWASSTITLISV